MACLFVCCAVGAVPTSVALAEPRPQTHHILEPRSGIWKAPSAIGKDRLSILTLEVRHGSDEDGAPQFRFYGDLREPDDWCDITATEGPSSDPRSLSVDCVGSGGKPDGRRLDLRFDQDDQEVVATWWRRGKPTTLRLRRPPQDPSTRFEGDWVSDSPNSFEHCVLHLYHEIHSYPAEFEDLNPDHLVSTIDVFHTDGGGFYGRSIRFYPNNGALSFSYLRNPAAFTGRLDAQGRRLVGQPGSMCGTFSRVGGDQKLQ